MPADQEDDILYMWGKCCFYPKGKEWKETPWVEELPECHYEYFQSSPVKRASTTKGKKEKKKKSTHLAKAAFP